MKISNINDSLYVFYNLELKLIVTELKNSAGIETEPFRSTHNEDFFFFFFQIGFSLLHEYLEFLGTTYKHKNQNF